MHIRAQEASCQLDHRVAEIDDGVPGDRAHILPRCGFTRRQDLQSAQSVEQEGDAAEIRVRDDCGDECGAVIACGLGRVFEDAGLVARGLHVAMQVCQGAAGEIQRAVKPIEDRGDDGMREFGIRTKGGYAVIDDGGAGDIFETCEMVFREAVRLDAVFVAVAIDDDFSRTFVSTGFQRLLTH